MSHITSAIIYRKQKSFRQNFIEKLNKYFKSSTKSFFFKITKQKDWYALRLYPYLFRHFVDTVGQQRGPESVATSTDCNKTRSAADMLTHILVERAANQ